MEYPMKPEWRNLTLGEVYDELRRIRETGPWIDGQYDDIREKQGSVPSNVADELMSLDRSLAEEQTILIEQLFPILKEIPVKAFIIEMGSASEAASWIESTVTKLGAQGVRDFRLTPEVTSIDLAEEGYWISLTLETKGSGPDKGVL
jgi:hypothetical protein